MVSHLLSASRLFVPKYGYNVSYLDKNRCDSEYELTALNFHQYNSKKKSLQDLA